MGATKDTASGDGVNHEQRAARIWPVLAEMARQGQTITYGQLAKAIGIHHRALGTPLWLIQDCCRDEKQLPLTILVVHQGDSKPGEGFIAWDVDDLEDGMKLVFDFDWSAIPNPFSYAEDGSTVEDLAARLVQKPELAEDIYQRVKVRGKAQEIFRAALLEAYDEQCAFCGLSFFKALDAAHILAWSKCKGDDRKHRMNPRNGILLCSNHHELFDAGDITVTEDFRIEYRDPDMKDGPYSDMDEVVTVKLHGQKMRLPEQKKLWPDPDFIRERYKED